MVKRLQNRVAESRLLLPFVGAYAILVWTAARIAGGELWWQFLCFAAASYLMVELNTANALIRIYSRMVSCSFMAMMCLVCGDFKSLDGGFAGLCAVASLSSLLHCYQNRNASGWVFYAFLALGVGSTVSVWTLYFVPVVWLLMSFFLSAMSWRTFMASIIGIVSPYWFAALYFFIQSGDMTTAADHFAKLADFGTVADFSVLTASQALTAALVVALTVTGTVHFIRTSYMDKIRTRMFYYCFITVSYASIAFLILQPQRYDLLIRVLIINASPLVGHFLALTNTRITNIAFVVITAAVAILTVANLWTLL